MLYCEQTSLKTQWGRLKMRYTNSEERKLEIGFFKSLAFLVFSLVVSLSVFLIYRPSATSRYNFPEYLVTEVSKPQLKTKAIEPVKSIPQEKAPQLISQSESAASRNGVVSVQSTAKTLTKMSDSDAKDFIHQAILMINQNQAGDAKKLLEKVLQDQPDNEEALVQLALVHIIDLKEEKLGQNYLERALKVNPDNKAALSELVEIYASRKDPAGVNYLQSLYDKNPDNNNLAMGIGQILIQDQPTAAIPYLQKAGEPALTDLAEAYSITGNHSKAIETYTRQEEIIANKLQSEDERSGLGKDNLVWAKMNIVNELLAQGKNEQAQKKLEEIKPLTRNEADFIALSNQFKSMKAQPKSSTTL